MGNVWKQLSYSLIIVFVTIFALYMIVNHQNLPIPNPLAKFNVADMCYAILQGRDADIAAGRYGFITGWFSNGMTFNIPAGARLDRVYFAPRQADYNSGNYNDLVMNLKVCNQYNCFWFEQMVYQQTFQNSYSQCMTDCNNYNWPNLCPQRAQLPAYSCDILCNFDSGMSAHFQDLPQSTSYTMSVVDTFHLNSGHQWTKDGSPQAPQMMYTIGYWTNQAPDKAPCPTIQKGISDGTVAPVGFVNPEGWETVRNMCCGDALYQDYNCAAVGYKCINASFAGYQSQDWSWSNVQHCAYGCNMSASQPASDPTGLCITPTCAACPDPTEWSSCTNGQSTRTTYVCGGDTGYQCVASVENKSCCVANATCSMWGTCTNNTQERLCDDGCENTYTENQNCTAECAISSDCHICFAGCVDGKCISAPALPCANATVSAYPECKLNSSACYKACDKECCVGENWVTDKPCVSGKVCENNQCKTNVSIDWSMVFFGIVVLFGSFLLIIAVGKWKHKW